MRLRNCAAALLLLVPASAVVAQECPRTGPDGVMLASSNRTIAGRLVLHEGLRRWWGLEVSPEVCGRREVQVIVNSGDDAEDRAQSRELDSLRGCDVRITGPLNIPGTGYFSAELYLTRHEVAADPGCVRQPLLPDYAGFRPSGNLRLYQVRLSFDYLPGDHPAQFVITAGTRRLTPSQPYASYDLTGEFVMYAHCGRGFEATSFRGAAAAHPWLIDGSVALDPEAARARHISHIELTYVCQRSRTLPE